MVALTIADARQKLNVDRKRPIQYRYGIYHIYNLQYLSMNQSSKDI